MLKPVGDGEIHVVGLDAESARIFMWTSQRLAEVGQDAQLYCRASGSPPPTVTWYYSDDQERMSDQQILPDDNQYKVTAFEFTLPSLVVIMLYGRFPESHFPGKTIPGKTFPGKKTVSEF